MAQNAREQLGPDLEDVDWTKYAPRQYDPRRIVLKALMDDGTLGASWRSRNPRR